jgi:hypothetical protein
MRYGWVRSNSFPTVDDAKAASREFHATRVDWFYPGSHVADVNANYVTNASQTFINWCHANGMKITGAMNANTTTAGWGLRPTTFGRYLGDPNNGAYAAAAVAWGKALVDAGLDAFVVDDFFYYNDSEMRSFNDNVLKPIKAYAPNFKIASNKGSALGTIYVAPYDFDFHFSDTSIVTGPGDWWEASKAHRAEESALLSHPNLANLSNAQRRQLIALSYAVGAHLIAPWDAFIQGGDRLFADPADFADLYGFVRAMGQKGYLNGYEDAAVGGYDLSETRYGSSPPLSVSGGSGYLSVFARAKPSEGVAPVVVHLVQSGAAQATTLRVRIDSLFDTPNVSCTLYSPKAYNAALHETARNTGDYSALAQAGNLSYSVSGDYLEISIPAFAPWGMLVIANQGHRVNISPASAQVFPGQSQTFTGTVVDPSGNPISPQPAINWSVDTAGSINSVGLFTAGNSPASGRVAATASLSGGETATGRQTVRVVSEIDSGSAARWQFNGDANDSMGVHHGTRYGGGSYSVWAAEGSNALYCDGVDNYVQIPDHPELDVGSGDFSYSLWFQREANTATNLRLISKGARIDSDAGYCLFGSDASISAVLGNGVSRKFISASHGGVGVYTHATVTIDRSVGLMKLYINGNLASQTDISDWSGQNLNSSEDLYFARTASDITPLFWDGRMDDVKIFHKALSSVEVSALFGGSSFSVSPEPVTWKSVPQASGYTSVRMEATAVAGSNVQYWFDEISGNAGGADSGWQDSPVFEADGLLAGTTYTYRVKARLLSANPSATAFSASSSATTDAYPDLDGDGIPDHLDSDIDGDGTPNDQEIAAGRDPYDASDLAFEFNRDGDDEGWNLYAVGISNLSVSGGTIGGVTTIADSRFNKGDLSFSAASVPSISVRIRSDVNGDFGLFSVSKTGTWVGFEKNYAGNGEWQVFTFPFSTNPAYAGSIGRLHFQAIKAANASFEIDWIRASPLAIPSLISTSPADDADAVALDANLVATFDEAVTAGSTGNIELWETGATAPLETFPVATSDRLVFSGQAVTIDPTALLELGKSYHLRIASGAVVGSGTGAAFAGISDETVWNFTADRRYASWIAAHGVEESKRALDADYDGDGIANGLENYFGTDPTQASRGIEMAGMDRQVRTFKFTHPKNANPASDIVGRYRWSTDLKNWHDSGETLNGSTVIFQTRTLDNGDTEVTATESGEALTELFITLEVTTP